jgi:hypothetical protein
LVCVEALVALNCGVVDVGSRATVELEEAVWTVSSSVGDGVDFSVGSGLLRTVDAGAGISGFSSAAFLKRLRYHKKRAMIAARSSNVPIMTPAKTPGLIPPELAVVVLLAWSTHLNELQVLQSLGKKRSERGKIEQDGKENLLIWKHC